MDESYTFLNSLPFYLYFQQHQITSSLCLSIYFSSNTSYCLHIFLSWSFFHHNRKSPQLWLQTYEAYIRLSWTCSFHGGALYLTALFPHFSYKVLGVLPRLVKGLDAISCGENINFLLPSYLYYCVTSVQVFIIYPGGEDHGQPLHRRFLPRQSTSLSIFLAAPDNVYLRLTL